MQAKRYQINLLLSITPNTAYGEPPLARTQVIDETVPLGEHPVDYLFARVEQAFGRVRDQMETLEVAAMSNDVADKAA